VFVARGFQAHVAEAYAAWLNAHATCRNDLKTYKAVPVDDWEGPPHGDWVG
jgi:hypothetical protein